MAAKAEHIDGKENPRFVVTSLTSDEWTAQSLYEELYCGFDEGRQKSRSMQQNSPANVQRSDEQMCLLYGATARVLNRRGGSQSTNSFLPALCS